MCINDPIGDLLTRIRNGQQAKMESVVCPFSKRKEKLLDVLKKEGYIRGYTVQDVRPGIQQLKVMLKYVESQPSIVMVKRVSTPGRRVYTSVDAIKPVQSGLGINILSTSKGIMSEVDARRSGIGGEVLCQVY